MQKDTKKIQEISEFLSHTDWVPYEHVISILNGNIDRLELFVLKSCKARSGQDRMILKYSKLS